MKRWMVVAVAGLLGCAAPMRFEVAGPVDPRLADVAEVQSRGAQVWLGAPGEVVPIDLDVGEGTRVEVAQVSGDTLRLRWPVNGARRRLGARPEHRLEVEVGAPAGNAPTGAVASWVTIREFFDDGVANPSQGDEPRSERRLGPMGTRCELTLLADGRYAARLMLESEATTWGDIRREVEVDRAEGGGSP